MVIGEFSMSRFASDDCAECQGSSQVRSNVTAERSHTHGARHVIAACHVTDASSRFVCLCFTQLLVSLFLSVKSWCVFLPLMFHLQRFCCRPQKQFLTHLGADFSLLPEAESDGASYNKNHWRPHAVRLPWRGTEKMTSLAVKYCEMERERYPGHVSWVDSLAVVLQND